MVKETTNICTVHDNICRICYERRHIKEKTNTGFVKINYFKYTF